MIQTLTKHFFRTSLALSFFTIVFSTLLGNNTMYHSSEYKTESPQDTISKQQFITWTNNWNNLGRAYSDTAFVKYYNMPLSDLQAVVNQNGSEAVLYQGLEELSPGKYIAHIILCGRDRNGKIVEKYYDVTTPCPPVCER